MKYKRDFITNSSSSSYIIADKSGNLDEILFVIHDDPEIIIDLFKILDHEEIDQGYGPNREYYTEIERNQIEKIIENNGRVYIFHASSDGSIIQNGLSGGINSDDIYKSQRDLIEIIKGDGY